MGDVIITNARIVSDFYDINKLYEIYISGGIIKEIGEKTERTDINAQVVDAGKMLVMPGLIDMNCKICEAGYENKDNIITVSKSAIEGGFTSITTSPRTQPVVDSKSVVEYVYSKAHDNAEINFYLYGSITKGCEGKEVAEMGEMISKGVIAISDGGACIDDSNLLRNVMLYLKMFNVPVVLGCLDERVADGGMVNSGYMSTKLGLKGSPTEAEVLMAARNLILAKYTGSRIHLSPLTTKDSIHMVRDYKKRDVQVTSATCPHYFTLSEKEIENFNTIAKVNPPLRTKNDINSVLYGLYDGTIDVISSGHTPAAYDRKNTEFEKAAYGISSLETALMVTFTELLTKEHKDVDDDISFTPLDIAKKMSENPAKILGLKGKGVIKEGMDADIIIVDDKNEYTVDASKFFSKAKYSPYEGQKFYGKCIGMICGGKILKMPKL